MESEGGGEVVVVASPLGDGVEAPGPAEHGGSRGGQQRGEGIGPAACLAVVGNLRERVVQASFDDIGDPPDEPL